MRDELINFDNLKLVLTDYINEVKREYENNLLHNNHPASWELINKIEIITDFKDRQFMVGLNLQDYWKYVELDTKPHFPPVDKLLEWIKIKPVLPYPNKNGKLPTPKQLAYLIGKKISEVGTKGTHDLGNANEAIYNKYKDLIEMALAEDVNKHIDGIMAVLYK